MTPFQRAFARAGHAHASVLVIAALICEVLADSADLTGLPAALARSGVPLAAVLFPAGSTTSLRTNGKAARGAARQGKFGYGGNAPERATPPPGVRGSGTARRSIAKECVQRRNHLARARP